MQPFPDEQSGEIWTQSLEPETHNVPTCGTTIGSKEPSEDEVQKAILREQVNIICNFRKSSRYEAVLSFLFFSHFRKHICAMSSKTKGLWTNDNNFFLD